MKKFITFSLMSLLFAVFHSTIGGILNKPRPPQKMCNDSLGEVFSVNASVFCQPWCISILDPHGGRIIGERKCQLEPGCVCPEPLLREHNRPDAKCVPREMCPPYDPYGKIEK